MEKQKTKHEAFVDYVIGRINAPDANTAFGAALRRADNPQLEYQSWEYLAHWCDIANERERKAYGLIAAAIARGKPLANGKNGIGRAIALYYTDGQNSGSEQSAAVAKMRRLLACDNGAEACVIIRPLLNLLSKSSVVAIDYALLLSQVLFSDDGFNEWVKPRWAKDFYHKEAEGEK